MSSTLDRSSMLSSSHHEMLFNQIILVHYLIIDSVQSINAALSVDTREYILWDNFYQITLLKWYSLQVTRGITFVKKSLKYEPTLLDLELWFRKLSIVHHWIECLHKKQLICGRGHRPLYFARLCTKITIPKAFLALLCLVFCSFFH